jgi:hypothetical protein
VAVGHKGHSEKVAVRMEHVEVAVDYKGHLGELAGRREHSESAAGDKAGSGTGRQAAHLEAAHCSQRMVAGTVLDQVLVPVPDREVGTGMAHPGLGFLEDTRRVGDRPVEGRHTPAGAAGHSRAVASS